MQTGWEISIANQSTENALPLICSAPSRQPVASLAWEDGVCITRDGLTLFPQYSPFDLFLSTVEDGKANPDLYQFKRGPSIGQDFTPPAGLRLTNDWMHSDLVISTRFSTEMAVSAWSLTNVKKVLFNDAAPQGILNNLDATIFVYTDDDNGPSYAPKIRILKNVSQVNLGIGAKKLPTSVSAANPYDENPHIERYDSGDPQRKWSCNSTAKVELRRSICFTQPVRMAD